LQAAHADHDESQCAMCKSLRLQTSASKHEFSATVFPIAFSQTG